MRHRLEDNKFGRSVSHREALMAALVRALIEQRRIRTTVQKAKAAASLTERLVTLARKGTLAARRRVLSALRHPKHVRILFESIAPNCQSRNSGYTRVVRVGRRLGDGAEMAILEWVDFLPVEKKKKAAEANPEKK